MYIFLLCIGYFLAYSVYGVVVRYYTAVQGVPGMEFLFHSTAGSMAVPLAVVLILWWPGRLKGSGRRIFGGRLPAEYAWLIPSGICTGFVIPTTSLMYTFGFNVMVAMIIMRASLIISSRAVDEILIRQGHSDKTVYWQENAAVVAALAALSIILMEGGKGGSFDFFRSTPFMVNMACYIIPYGLRIYILNRFKAKMDSRALFGIEQLWAAVTVVAVGLCLVALYRFTAWSSLQMAEFMQGVEHPNAAIMLWSISYGLVAFLSVFIFIYKRGSATFNTTVNRLTSLVAGTAATLVSYYFLGGKAVKAHEWWSLLIVFVAIVFLVSAERRRESELAGTSPATAGGLAPRVPAQGQEAAA